jgi:hypothetical protein
MSMVHLTKCQIIMVNLIKNQIRIVNLTKPYTFNMANLTKPFWWTFVDFDQIFNFTLGHIYHFSETYWSNITCFSYPKPLIKMDIPFCQCGHFNQVGFLKSHDFLQCLQIHTMMASPFANVRLRPNWTHLCAQNLICLTKNAT